MADNASSDIRNFCHYIRLFTPFIAHQDDRDALAEYLDSLERIELLDPGITLPAHGATVEQGRAPGPPNHPPPPTTPGSDDPKSRKTINHQTVTNLLAGHT